MGPVNKITVDDSDGDGEARDLPTEYKPTTRAVLGHITIDYDSEFPTRVGEIRLDIAKLLNQQEIKEYSDRIGAGSKLYVVNDGRSFDMKSVTTTEGFYEFVAAKAKVSKSDDIRTAVVKVALGMKQDTDLDYNLTATRDHAMIESQKDTYDSPKGKRKRTGNYGKKKRASSRSTDSEITDFVNKLYNTDDPHNPCFHGLTTEMIDSLMVQASDPSWRSRFDCNGEGTWPDDLVHFFSSKHLKKDMFGLTPERGKYPPEDNKPQSGKELVEDTQQDDPIYELAGAVRSISDAKMIAKE